MLGLTSQPGVRNTVFGWDIDARDSEDWIQSYYVFLVLCAWVRSKTSE